LQRTSGASEILSQEAFLKIIALERKRSERSRKPFLLMLIDGGAPLQNGHTEPVLREVLRTLAGLIRETDAAGWYSQGVVAGVMFTEIGTNDHAVIVPKVITHLRESLTDRLGADRVKQLQLSFHLFPDDWNHEISGRPSNATLYPDLAERDGSQRKLHTVKRVMDITGSVLAILTLAPVLFLIAMAVKLSSKGPIFFKQKRVGQYGESFTFLKFRSMYHGNDSKQHEEFTRQLIKDQATPQGETEDGQKIYKLANDSRITRVGKFLRRTSLDELPQFFNVLKGEMSLVGPRPPIPYEVEEYDIWHRRRLLEAKPGITGLWQVHGRSTVKFDDMVRLDLQYARNWTPWMDITILLRTPAAVVLGAGAQ
jgi:lipopolysaccharide/colanic/teichoic acid biosynthesis glycosyltransferase